jgi:prevent-host-death family protein
MYRIRPVSDLRNKFTEIERSVTLEGPVFLTKNGYGSMVVMSIEDYSMLTDTIELKLDEADRAAAESDTRYTHGEVFETLKKVFNGDQKVRA